MSGRQDFGNFAGAFATAFSQGQQQRKDNAARDKYAKLQSDLIKMQLEASENLQDAQTKVGDLMGGIERSPGGRPMQQFESLPDVGDQIGEIQPAGMGGQEMLDSPEGIAALLASGQMKDMVGLAQEERLQSTEERNAGLFEAIQSMLPGADGGAGGGSPLTVSGMSVDEGGAGFTFGPNPEFRTPRSNELTAFNLGQFSTEATQAIDLSKSIQDSKFVGLGSSMAQGARDIQSNLAAIGETFGLTSPEYREAVAKFDELGKLYATMEGQENAKWSRDNPGGTPTDAVRRQIKARVPTVDKSPAANFRLIANMLERELKENDINQVPMTREQVSETEDAIAKLRGAADDLGVSTTPQAVGAIEEMSLEQVEALLANPEVLKANPEVLDAAEARWSKLNAD